MSVQPITGSNTKYTWSQLPRRVQKNKESDSSLEKSTLTFVSDFTSPADEIELFKRSKTESQKAAKGSRPFSHTSENWIG